MKYLNVVDLTIFEFLQPEIKFDPYLLYID